MGAIERIEPTLIAIATRCLRLAPGELDPNAPLARYGLDSLTAIELCVAIHEATGIEVSEDALLDAHSLSDIARRLEQPNAPSDAPERVLDAMYADAILPANIRPTGAPRPVDARPLITGANGFLGVHLLATLLARDARSIVCLVRATDNAHALERIRSSCARYGIEAIDLDHRVRAIAADITLPMFGLPIATYDELAREVSGIYHCAAGVNWALGYAALRAANVVATRELLRFACSETHKRFRFVSSVAACYSTGSQASIDEASAAADPAGIHFGYGQSKWVAERLVETARARGLRASIVRPSLIAGSGVNGIGNDDDFLAVMLRGAIALGYAPEIDWRIDASPVEFVAAALAALDADARGAAAVLHLRNPKPARWAEIVLWMNLRGYPVRTESFAAWVVRAERASRDPRHPLHALRGFLFKQPIAGDDRYLPQWYAAPHVSRFDAQHSDALLAQRGIVCPRMSAALLGRYFDHWVARGLIAPSRRAARAGPALASPARLDEAIERALRARLGDDRLRVRACVRQELDGDHSILGELAAWHGGSALAMHARTLEIEHADGHRSTLDMIVKPKIATEAVLDVMAAVVAQCSPALADAFAAYRPYSELRDTAKREVAIYAHASSPLRAHRPMYFGVTEIGECRALLIERITHANLIDAVNDVAVWTPAHIRAALRDIATIHGHWLGRESDVRALLGRDAANGAEAFAAADAWHLALSAYVRPWFEDWMGRAGADRHACLVCRARADSARVCAHPRSLIHHDFNPRNIALRGGPRGPTLCAFDWELADYGMPQRDAVELLCFVLPENASRETLTDYLEYHRVQVETQCGQRLDPTLWIAGVRLALADFGVRRLPLYVLAHRFRPQAFLKRVAKTWCRIASLLDASP